MTAGAVGGDWDTMGLQPLVAACTSSHACILHINQSTAHLSK